MSMPYAGKQFTFHNPDGSQIEVRGWGNQSAAVFETLDGYTVVKDPPSGFYHYATLSGNGEELVEASGSGLALQHLLASVLRQISPYPANYVRRQLSIM